MFYQTRKNINTKMMCWKRRKKNPPIINDKVSDINNGPKHTIESCYNKEDNSDKTKDTNDNINDKVIECKYCYRRFKFKYYHDVYRHHREHPKRCQGIIRARYTSKEIYNNNHTTPIIQYITINNITTHPSDNNIPNQNHR